MRLTGRAAIITGANQGLGLAIAEHYLKENADLLLVARGEERLVDAQRSLLSQARAEQRVEIVVGDISQPETCRRAVDCFASTFRGIPILVNNAGVYGPMGPIEDVDWTRWVEALQVNLFGTVLMCRAFIPLARSRRVGKIINLSGGGATAPLPRISAYAASKAAVVRFTETIALELSDASIDVNAIAPGALNTRLLEEVLSAGPQKVGVDFYNRSLKQQANGGAPLSAGAELAVMLASSQSDGISGRLFSAVWDDWQNLPNRRDQLAKSDVYTLRRITPEDRGMEWKCA